MQVEGADHVVGQEEEQESHHHHGNQVHAAAVLDRTGSAGPAAAVGAGVGHQALDQLAVAKDDGEERQEEAESHGHVV